MSAVIAFETNICELIRSRRRQHLVEYALRGLSAGLFTAAAVLLVLKVAGIDRVLWATLVVVLGTALAASLFFAWRSRPGALTVAAQADRKLGLKERLGTAVEYLQRDTNPVLCERLANQALKARLPSRPDKVFSVRFDTWASMVPVGAALVAVVLAVDLPKWPAPERSMSVDRDVVEAGLKLEDYARAMRARAAAQQMHHVEQRGEDIAAAAGQMRSGTLSRSQALTRLRGLSEQLGRDIRAALQSGTQTEIGPVGFNRLPAPSNGPSTNLKDLLSRILSGQGTPEDAMDAAQNSRALVAAGVSKGALQAALREHRNGNSEALSDLVGRLTGDNPGPAAAKELAQARQELDRTREQLGEAGALTRSGPAGSSRFNAGETGRDLADNQSDDTSDQDGADLDGGDVPGQGSRPGNQRRGPGGPGGAKDANAGRGPLLKADPRFSAGGIMSGEARVAPRRNTSAIEGQSVNNRYGAQDEAVLANEHIPPHQKDLVRRYFLMLNQEPVDAEEGPQ